MTLTQYGSNYSTFSFTELKQSLRNRGIQAPARDRRQMIAALRTADRNTTFRFLDLPPELRNIVYGLILAPSAQTDGFTYYHPSVLRCSKQVHNEAGGLLNDTAHADIWLRTGDGLDVCFQGRLILRTGPGRSSSSVEALSWPRLLANIRSINLKVDIRSPDYGFGERVNEGDPINHALYQLYTFLSKRKAAELLRVEISSIGRANDFVLWSILSPLCALAGRFRDPVFVLLGLSDHISAEIRKTAKIYRGLLLIGEEVGLASELNDAGIGVQVEGLENYDSLVKGWRGFRYYVFLGSEDLPGKVLRIQNDVDKITDYETMYLPAYLQLLQARLKKMREERRVKEHDAECQ